MGVRKVLRELGFYTVVFVVSVGLAVGLRVFVVTSIIKIPSGSMEPAVLAGDRIIVTKLIPGPRVFQSLRQIRVDGKVMTKHFKGVRQVRRNDVMVFNFPYTGGWDRVDMDLNVLYLKRCVALPGDTFSIENGIYRVKNCTDPIGCSFRQQELTQRMKDDFTEAVWKCFPFDTVNYRWNIKDFGPLYVPASGATIVPDTLNQLLYKTLIEYETGKTISVRDGSVFLNDDRIDSYTFRLNYYFMAGDYIYDSCDSRYWGLLPEDCIIGKAILVWRSTNLQNGKVRWNRVWKRIR